MVIQEPEQIPLTTTLEPITLSLDDTSAAPVRQEKPEPKRHKKIHLPGEDPPAEKEKPKAKEKEEERTPVAALQPPPPPPAIAPPPPPPKEPPAPPPAKKKKVERRAVAKTAAKNAPTGFLNVGARPWAHISIDGKRWPYQTPQAGIELPAGKHNITLTNDETGVTKSQSVIIKAGAYRTVMMDMRKK